MDSANTKCATCDAKDVETYCLICIERHCKECTKLHAHLVATEKHCTINISTGKIYNLEDDNLLNCYPCKKQNIVSAATSLCPVCQELQCPKCNLFHGKSKITKRHSVIALSRGGHGTTSKSTRKMADSQQQQSSDDSQLASDFEDELHITGATSVDFALAQAPVSALSSGGASNVAPAPVTNMAYVGTFDVKLDSDSKKCGITGITCLSDGRVVIVDRNNKKVKVYSANCKYLYCVDYSGDLYGITVVSSTTVVVIEDNTLRYLQLDPQRGVELDRHINISGGDAVAVSYAAHTFAVLCVRPNKVEMINDSGDTLTVVNLTQVKYDPAYTILLDNTGTRFYICDYYNHRVLCYSCQPGHTGLLWECSMSPNPHSVVHVGDSLVVLCHKNVHEINKSGQHLQQVVVHGQNFSFSRPLAAFQSSCRKLFVVSRRWLGNNPVRIFQL